MAFVGAWKLLFSTGGAFVVVGVVVIVLVLSAGGVSAQPSGASHGRVEVSTRAAGASGCTRELFDGLAVLRRPQTAADRSFDPSRSRVSGISHGAPAKSGYASVARLGRLARTLPDGLRVYLAVYAPAAGSPAALVGDIVYAYVVDPGGREATFAGEASGPFLATAVRLPPLIADHVLVQIVPDAVSEVRWTFPRERIPRVPGVSGAKVIPGGTVTANVIGNVAAAREVPWAIGPPSVATWLTARGRVIKTYRSAMPSSSQTRTSGTVTGTATPIGC